MLLIFLESSCSREAVFASQENSDLEHDAKCREAVMAKGATWTDTPTGSTDFLVIAANGENTSPDSTKVSACMALKSKGYPCFALAEEFWVAHLNERTKEDRKSTRLNSSH